MGGRYTVSEIDAMRRAARELWAAKRAGRTFNASRYDPETMRRESEDELRTYITAGVTVRDLEGALMALVVGVGLDRRAEEALGFGSIPVYRRHVDEDSSPTKS